MQSDSRRRNFKRDPPRHRYHRLPVRSSPLFVPASSVLAAAPPFLVSCASIARRRRRRGIWRRGFPWVGGMMGTGRRPFLSDRCRCRGSLPRLNRPYVIIFACIYTTMRDGENDVTPNLAAIASVGALRREDRVTREAPMLAFALFLRVIYAGRVNNIMK